MLLMHTAFTSVGYNYFNSTVTFMLIFILLFNLQIITIITTIAIFLKFLLKIACNHHTYIHNYLWILNYLLSLPIQIIKVFYLKICKQWDLKLKINQYNWKEYLNKRRNFSLLIETLILTDYSQINWRWVFKCVAFWNILLKVIFKSIFLFLIY